MLLTLKASVIVEQTPLTAGTEFKIAVLFVILVKLEFVMVDFSAQNKCVDLVCLEASDALSSLSLVYDLVICDGLVLFRLDQMLVV